VCTSFRKSATKSVSIKTFHFLKQNIVCDGMHHHKHAPQGRFAKVCSYFEVRSDFTKASTCAKNSILLFSVKLWLKQQQENLQQQQRETNHLICIQLQHILFSVKGKIKKNWIHKMNIHCVMTFTNNFH